MRLTNSIIGMTVLVVVACSLSASLASASAIPVPQLTGNVVAQVYGYDPTHLSSSLTICGGSCLGGFTGLPKIHAPAPPCYLIPGTHCGWTWSGSMNGEHIGFLVEVGIEALTFDGVVTGTYSGGGTASFYGPLEFSDNETEQITFFGKWTKGFGGGGPTGLYSVGSLTGLYGTHRLSMGSGRYLWRSLYRFNKDVLFKDVLFCNS